MISPVVAVEKGPSEPLTIQAALELAFKNNPELRLAGLSVDKAQIQRDNAFDMVDYFPPMGLGTFVFNQVFNGYQQAEIGLNTAKKGEQAAGDKLTKDVVEAYTEALTNYNQMQSMEMTVRNIRALHVVSNVANQVGFISPYDYDGSVTGLEQAERKSVV